MLESGGWSYIAIDESNHGSHPEIFAAVFSNHPFDIIEHNSAIFSKQRGIHPNLSSKLNKNRDFTYVVATQDDFENATSYSELFGKAIASLLKKKQLADTIRIYIDGPLSKKKYNHVVRAIEQSILPGTTYEVISGNHLDRRIQLVNLADEVAYWLCRYWTKRGKHHQKQTKLTHTIALKS